MIVNIISWRFECCGPGGVEVDCICDGLEGQLETLGRKPLILNSKFICELSANFE